MKSDSSDARPPKAILIAPAFLSILLVCAFVWDCTRTVRHAYGAYVETDRELQMCENQLTAFVQSLNITGSAFKNAQNEYREAKNAPSRRAAFQKILAGIPLQSANNLPRYKFDTYAGMLNRCQISLRRYQEAVAGYNQVVQSFTGKIGKSLTGLPQQL